MPPDGLDRALQPLLDLGAHLTRAAKNTTVVTPDHRIHVAYVFPHWSWPSWRVLVHDEPFEQPLWGAHLNRNTPIEVVAAVTTTLARLHQGKHPLFDFWGTAEPASALDGFADAGWQRSPGLRAYPFRYRAANGDRASATHHNRAGRMLDPFQSGQDGCWDIDGVKDDRFWSISVSEAAPALVLTSLVDAITQVHDALNILPPVWYATGSTAALSDTDAASDPARKEVP
ncbi:DUF317 domain-containing protein [Kitasatospora sp. NPDC056446]|uniref:DUF317 domain-containing protein n=1 Tax=Kitasatospora sp. NPDC056446 TaxID=3345819 RepID=UPI003689CBFE